MNIRINDKETEVGAKSMLELATELSLPEKGVAVAVNNKMAPRAQWGDTLLNNGDNVVIIKAVCGG